MLHRSRNRDSNNTLAAELGGTLQHSAQEGLAPTRPDGRRSSIGYDVAQRDDSAKGTTFVAGRMVWPPERHALKG